MQKLKVLFLITFLIQLFSTNQLYAKFRLSKIKDSIKDTINKATKQTKKTFEKLINKTKKEQPVNEGEQKREAFFNAISNAGQALVKGLNVYDRKLAKKLKKTDKFIKKLFWAKQDEFIIQLEQALLKSKKQGRQILYEKLMQVYANKKAPLIDFAVEIHQEGEQAQRFVEKLREFNKERIEDKTKVEKLEKTVEKLNNVIEKIEKLSLITDELLKGS